MSNYDNGGQIFSSNSSKTTLWIKGWEISHTRKKNLKYLCVLNLRVAPDYANLLTTSSTETPRSPNPLCSDWNTFPLVSTQTPDLATVTLLFMLLCFTAFLTYNDLRLIWCCLMLLLFTHYSVLSMVHHIRIICRLMIKKRSYIPLSTISPITCWKQSTKDGYQPCNVQLASLTFCKASCWTWAQGSIVCLSLTLWAECGQNSNFALFVIGLRTRWSR